MASSKWLPASLMEEEFATPFMVSTAISVVPPPISTTKCPLGPLMSRPAPSAAAKGSSIRYTRRAPASIAALITARSSIWVTELGTLTMTLGLGVNREALSVSRKNFCSIFTVRSWSATTPSFSGCIAATLPGVRPSIFRAAAPICKGLPVFLSMATTEGSRVIIPLSAL